MDVEVLGLSLHSLLVNPALLCCLGFSGITSLEVLRPLRSRLQETSLPECTARTKEPFCV